MRGPLHLVSTPPPPPWLGSSEGGFDSYFWGEWLCHTFDLKNFSVGYDLFFSGSIYSQLTTTFVVGVGGGGLWILDGLTPSECSPVGMGLLLRVAG